MEAETIISLVALVISILGTIFNFLFSRRGIKIMERQLNILTKEEEKRKTLANLSYIIGDVIKNIKEYIEPGYYFIDPLDMTMNNILCYIHDEKIDNFILKIKNKSIESFIFHDNNAYSKLKFNEYNKFKTWVLEKEYTDYCIFKFNCEPNVIQDTHLNTRNIISSIRSLYKAYKQIENYDHIINIYDNNLLNDFNNYINNILKTIFENMMKIDEIPFSSIEKSEEIYKKLENKLFGMENINKILEKINNICTRLSNVQKEIFIRSLK